MNRRKSLNKSASEHWNVQVYPAEYMMCLHPVSGFGALLPPLGVTYSNLRKTYVVSVDLADGFERGGLFPVLCVFPLFSSETPALRKDDVF